MSATFSTPVEPERLANSGEILEGRVWVASLARLRAQLARHEGEAIASIRFLHGADDRIRIAGRVDAAVWVICQTCLEPVEVALASEFELALVEDLGSASEAMPEMDVWLREARLVDLREVLDQELTLALPQIPRHPEREACGGLAANPALMAPEAEAMPAVSAENTRRPFEVLAGVAKRGREPDTGSNED